MKIIVLFNRFQSLAFLVVSLVLVGGFAIPRAAAFNETERSHMLQQLVAKFCERTEWLSCFGDQPSRCSQVVSRFVEPCLKQHLDGAQGPIADAMHARQIAEGLLKCFNAEFSMSHPMGKTGSPECANAPAHIQ